MIETILKRANEVASLKKAAGAKGWTMEDCLKEACSECFASYNHLQSDEYDVTTMKGDTYPVSVHNNLWVTGWI